MSRPRGAPSSVLAMLSLMPWCDAVAADVDATFVFTNDIHACRMEIGLSPNCAAEGKTDASLLRHIGAINAMEKAAWPAMAVRSC